MNIIKRTTRNLYRKKFWIIGIVVIGIILFALFRPKPPRPIEVQKVKQGNLVQSISISGKIAAKKFADLTFPVGGTLAFLGIKQGDQVAQYQTIATLDTRTAQRNMRSAMIDYAKQRNTFDETQNTYQNRTPQQALNDSMKRILQNNQNDLDKAINSVELQELVREQSILTTPIAGIVTRADAKSEGITISPTTVFEIVDPTSLVFAMDVDEADIGKIQTGQQAKIVLDPFPDDTLKIPVNQIDFVSHTTSTGSNVYTVEAVLTDGGGKYRVGMNGNAEINTGEEHDALIIPLAAVVDGNYVFVKKGTTFVKRNIKLGVQNDTDTQVTKGLNIGEEVAIEPTRVSTEMQVK